MLINLLQKVVYADQKKNNTWALKNKLMKN